MRRLVLVRALSISFLALLACGGPSPVEDAGSGDAGGRIDAQAARCERDLDCEDSLFCTEHRCVPGAPAADARGCVLEDRCSPGYSCDEAAEACVPEACAGDPDRDDDLEPSMACGGFDCDDDDRNRYPGNPNEVCDAEGHDEDCDDATVSSATDGDRDGDGFVSSACCNGATCGDDCDDDDRAAYPGARELCNGRDDDCDGSVDEAGATPLCPGGVCTAGRCDLEEWSRTFGGTSEDAVNAITMDTLGNVYVIGYFRGSAAFGSSSGPETSTPGPDGSPTADIFIAAYAPDGRYRWTRTYGSDLNDLGYDIAFDPVSGLLFATGFVWAPADFGGGPRTGVVLLALDAEGTYQWDRAIDTDAYLLTVDARDGPVVAGFFRGTRNFGGASHTAVATEELFVARFDAAGAHRWDFVSVGAAGARITPGRVGIDDTGRVTVAGFFSAGDADFGSGTRRNAGGEDLFAVALEADGRPRWDYAAGGTGDDRAYAMRVARSGQVFLVGAFEGTVDFGSGSMTAPAAESAFLLALDAAGALARITTWGGGSVNAALAVDFNSLGDVLVAGAYSGSVNFGGGLVTAPAEGASYLVTFDSSFAHVDDATYTYPGFPSAACPAAGGCGSGALDLVVGPADSTALAGVFSGSLSLGADVRASAGDLDGFVLRLAN